MWKIRAMIREIKIAVTEAAMTAAAIVLNMVVILFCVPARLPVLTLMDGPYRRGAEWVLRAVDTSHSYG